MGPGHEKDMLSDIDISRTREQLLRSSSDDSDDSDGLNSDVGLENNRRVKNQSTKMASKAKYEPPSFVSNTKSYATYKDDLKDGQELRALTKSYKQKWLSIV